MRKIKYWIVDYLHAYAIRHDLSELENQMWMIKWQQTYKWYGDQEWCEMEETDYYVRKKGDKLLYKFFV